MPVDPALMQRLMAELDAEVRADLTADGVADATVRASSRPTSASASRSSSCTMPITGRPLRRAPRTHSWPRSATSTPSATARARSCSARRSSWSACAPSASAARSGAPSALRAARRSSRDAAVPVGTRRCVWRAGPAASSRSPSTTARASPRATRSRARPGRCDGHHDLGSRGQQRRIDEHGTLVMEVAR